MKRGEAPQPDEAAKVIEAARDTRRKAAFLLRKPYVEQREVYTLAKAFFKAYLHKGYEFTGEELKKELHKVYLSSGIRERTEGFVEKISLFEYTDTTYSQAEMKLLLHELDEIVQALVTEHKRQLPALTRFANWLFRKREKQQQTVISEYPVLEANDPTTIDMNTMLEGIYAALDEHKVERAAKQYKRLVSKYDQLGSSVQQEFYHKVHAAYDAILRQTQ